MNILITALCFSFFDYLIYGVFIPQYAWKRTSYSWYQKFSFSRFYYGVLKVCGLLSCINDFILSRTLLIQITRKFVIYNRNICIVVSHNCEFNFIARHTPALRLMTEIDIQFIKEQFTESIDIIPVCGFLTTFCFNLFEQNNVEYRQKHPYTAMKNYQTRTTQHKQ